MEGAAHEVRVLVQDEGLDPLQRLVYGIREAPGQAPAAIGFHVQHAQRIQAQVGTIIAGEAQPRERPLPAQPQPE